MQEETQKNSPQWLLFRPQQVRDAERTQGLIDEGCYSQFLIHPHPTERVFLFFHGFTATPAQFLPIARNLHREGHNVVIPLMPGHGQAGEWHAKQPPPLPIKAQIYKDFANKWLDRTIPMGKQVVVGGLSGGGAVAAWLAFARPKEISRALLYAAYLSSSSRVVDLLVRRLRGYHEWTGKVKFGYHCFTFPQLSVFLEIGDEVMRRSRRQKPAPLFAISSESDRAVGNRDHRTLFERSVKHQPLCWYHCFDRVLDIPHTMLTETEGNQYQNLLVSMTKAYTESELTWSQVQEIAYRMSQGRTFDDVVAELGWRDRVSPHMPAMMTLVDKRSIAMKRQKNWRR
jgi:carboxylesterase